MRKVVLVIFTILSFLSFQTKVKAAGEPIYDITNLTVSDTTITVTGWAYTRENGGSSANPKLYATSRATGTRIEFQMSSYSNGNYGNIWGWMCMRNSSTNACIADSNKYYGGGFQAILQLDKLAESMPEDLEEDTFDITIVVGGHTINLYVNDQYLVSKNAGDYHVSVDNSVKRAQVITTYSRVLKESGNYFRGTLYWTTGTTYDIVGMTKHGNNCGSSATKYEDCVTLYQLSYTTSYSNCGKSGSSTVNVGAGSSCTGYAPVSWLTIIGNASITFTKEVIEEVECPNIDDELSCNGTANPESNCDTTLSVDVNAQKEDAEKAAGSGAYICEWETTKPLNASLNFQQKETELKFTNPVLNVISGQPFTFSIDYKNTAYWKYNEEPTCPVFTVTYVEADAEYVYDTEAVYDRNGNFAGYRDIMHPCSELGAAQCGKCAVSTATYYSSEECPARNSYRNSEAEDKMEELIGTKYEEIDENLSVSLPPSDPVEGTYNFNTWTCDYSNLGKWEREEGQSGRTVTCEYRLPYGLINKITAYVSYSDNPGDDNYLSYPESYFTALKQPTGNVNISITMPNLSVLPFLTTWNYSYSCDIACQQKLYGLTPGEGGDGDGGYLYFYRPIDLVNPFPDRQAGENWIDWWSSSENQKRLANSYSELEYVVNLNSNSMALIRDYNNDKTYDGTGYLDYSIDVNGNSSFIRRDFSNYFTLQNVTHSGLGVFEE